jgi:hypothetical protein
VLPAVAVAGLLLAASIGTYQIVRIHDRMVAAAIAAARYGSSSRDPATGRSPGPAGRSHPAPRLTPVARPHRLPRLKPLPRMPPLPRLRHRPAASQAADSERGELTRLASLLQRSASVRTDLNAATHAVADCVMAPATGLRSIEEVIGDRSQLLDAAVQAPVASIPDGAGLLAELVSGLRFSLAADGQFANWASGLGDTCPVPTLASSSFQAALSDSGRANTAKSQFLEQWNPLAAGYRLPTFRADQI